MASKNPKQQPPRPREAPPAARKPAPAVRKPAEPATPPDWRAWADRYARPALMGLLVVAFVLRVLNLDALTLWVDEFVHVQRAQNFVAGEGPLLTDDNNGILLTMIIIPLFKLFGSTAFWARIPSVLFGVGIVYLLYRLGARLFNRYVGLLAAFAGVFSLYLNFWSRMARNYAIFGFFFLLLGLLFLLVMDGQKDRSSGRFWTRFGLAPRYLPGLAVVLVLSLMSHQLTFFFAFSAATYAIMVAAGKWIQGADDRKNNPFLWIAGVSLPVMLAIFVPAFNGIFKSILGAFLPARIVEWVLPQWSRLAELWATKPWESFGIYHGVLRYDPTILYFPAVAGLAAAWWLRPRSGAWLTASIVVPLLLMSFIFREPSDPRYMIVVFPYFLLSAAAFFYAAWKFLSEKAWAQMPNTLRWLLLVLPLAYILGSVRWAELKKLVLAEQLYGHVTDMNVSNWAFTNWKQPADYVKAQGQPDDIIMATIPDAVRYYLQNDDVLWFRQAHYDTGQKKYVPNLPDSTARYSAHSFEDFKRTVETTPRGWLFADYYFDNIFTDDRSRFYIFQNLHFYPDASKDGSVMLFGWDRARPKPQQQNMVVQIGKSKDKLISREFFMTPPESLLGMANLEINVRATGVNSGQEAFVLLNDQNAIYLPANKTKDIEMMTLTVKREWLRQGKNKIQIGYNDKLNPSKDPDPGFTLYFLALNGK